MEGQESDWAKLFLAAVEEPEEQVVYAVPAEWWNDFYSYMLIVQEGQDCEIEGVSEFLTKDNRFNNQFLINEKHFQDRRQTHLKMQEMTKDHIKTIHDYFSLDTSKKLYEDYCLIGSKPYNLLQHTTGGGPHLRMFVSNSTEQKKKSQNLLNNSDSTALAACLQNEQFIDLDTIQAGFIVKSSDKAFIEYGYYPRNMEFLSLLSAITKQYNEILPKKISFTINQKNGSTYGSPKIVEFGVNESVNTLAELGVRNGDMLVFDLESQHDKESKENGFLEDDWAFDKIAGNSQNRDFVEGLQLDAVLHANNNRPQHTQTQGRQNHLSRNNSSTDGDEEEGDQDGNTNKNSNFGLAGSNGRMDESTEESEGASLNRSSKQRNRNNISLNEDDNHYNKCSEQEFPTENRKIHGNQQMNNFGVAKTQEEIDRVRKEVNSKIDKAGQLLMPSLPAWEVLRNITEMIRQLGGEIRERNQQKAKQEQAEQFELVHSEKQELLFQKPLQIQQALRQERRGEEEDSYHTSSTSTQSENDSNHNTNFAHSSHTQDNLFDHSNILDADLLN